MSKDYFERTTRARHDKAINTLLGILEGIAADQTINPSEWVLLSKWVEGNNSLAACHPYNELIPRLTNAMDDGKISDEEHQDLTWLCMAMRSKEYYDLITADLQRLQAVLAGIASDGVVSEAEIEQLTMWLSEHEHLRKCWPYEEVDSVITGVMQDNKIDESEHKMLLQFFSSFGATDMDFQTSHATKSTLPGVCAVSPEIIFPAHRFCFTGESARATRDEMIEMASKKGARVVETVSPRLDYLITGASGNPCWAYACYGRKIEKAMQLRQQGAHILIVHENDFFDNL